MQISRQMIQCHWSIRKWYFSLILRSSTFVSIPHPVAPPPSNNGLYSVLVAQALISFQKIYAPSSSLLQGKHLPFTPSPLIFFAYLWSFRWPNYIATLPRYFSFRPPHLNIITGPPSNELDKNIQRKSHFLFFSP